MLKETKEREHINVRNIYALIKHKLDLSMAKSALHQSLDSFHLRECAAHVGKQASS